MEQQEIRKHVRQSYAKIAKEQQSSCCGPVSSCCGSSNADTLSQQIGYSKEQLESLPTGANMGLGCGMPLSHAGLKPGEVVLDLGSGGGLDCFIAAKEVGDTGRVIGVDMTPDMIDLARKNTREGGYKNVEFRLGEIENLPVADGSVDVVISNCVINLSPDKGQVFKEIFRVLKPGGRFIISDMVITKPLPDFILKSMEAYSSCIAGALLKDDYLNAIKQAGFHSPEVIESVNLPVDLMANDPTAQNIVKNNQLTQQQVDEIGKTVESMKVRGWKAA
ncbi:MAG: arsenite methyltransferase [bacterium]|nr:arsenite methyltransferase [bacterium]